MIRYLISNEILNKIKCIVYKQYLTININILEYIINYILT